jgi:hypothetical protein
VEAGLPHICPRSELRFRSGVGGGAPGCGGGVQST